MNGTVILENAKVLNVVNRETEDHSIKWVEIVAMQESDINTITCDTETAKILQVDNYYDLVLKISENLKAGNNGYAYKVNKFKVIGAYEKE